MSRRYTGTHTITELCAFWAIVISGFSYLLGGVIRLIKTLIKDAPHTLSIINSIISVFTFLGNIALIIAVAIPAWQFVKYRSTGWKVVYWIALVGFALGAVLGLLGGLGIF